jgi:hypothetical protein
MDGGQRQQPIGVGAALILSTTAAIAAADAKDGRAGVPRRGGASPAAIP